MIRFWQSLYRCPLRDVREGWRRGTAGRLGCASASLAIIFAAACADRGAPADFAVRHDSSGVEIVTSSGTDRALTWAVTEERRIGGKSDGPEAFSQLARGQVTASGLGQLVVLDPSRHQVFVFDTAGNFVLSFGRRGSGPGELTFPVRVTGLPDGSLGVYDLGAGGYSRYDSKGATLGFLRTATITQSADVLPMANGGLAFLGDSGALGGGPRAISLTAAAAGQQTRLMTLLKSRIRATLGNCTFPFDLERVFAPNIAWTTGAASLFGARTDVYEIRVFRDDSLIRIIRRTMIARAATEALAIQATPTVNIPFPSGTCTVPSADVVRASGIADVVPLIREVAVSPEGELWVWRYSLPGEPEATDVFDPNGGYIGTLASPLPATFLSPSLHAVIKRDTASGLSSIAIVRVKR